MARQAINRGTTAGDGTGETAFSAFGKVNDNFTELYNQGPAHPGYIAGNWYPTLNTTVAGAAAFNSTTVAKLYPFMVAELVTIDELGAYVSTLSAGGNFQLAIFGNDAATNKPSGLPLAYTAATLSTAAVSIVSGALNVSVQLEPGILYWAACAVDNTTAAFTTFSGASNLIPFVTGAPNISDYQGAAAVQNLLFNITHSFATNMSALNINPASVTTTGATVVRLFLTHFKVLSVP